MRVLKVVRDRGPRARQKLVCAQSGGGGRAPAGGGGGGGGLLSFGGACWPCHCSF